MQGTFKNMKTFILSRSQWVEVFNYVIIFSESWSGLKWPEKAAINVTALFSLFLSLAAPSTNPEDGGSSIHHDDFLEKSGSNRDLSGVALSQRVKAGRHHLSSSAPLDFFLANSLPSPPHPASVIHLALLKIC
jgi:hypothetical protein